MGQASWGKPGFDRPVARGRRLQGFPRTARAQSHRFPDLHQPSWKVRENTIDAEVQKAAHRIGVVGGPYTGEHAGRVYLLYFFLRGLIRVHDQPFESGALCRFEVFIKLRTKSIPIQFVLLRIDIRTFLA